MCRPRVQSSEVVSWITWCCCWKPSLSSFFRRFQGCLGYLWVSLYNSVKMSGILKMVRQHPAVMPVFVITFVGAGFATTAIVRACLFYTDVSFDRKNNQHPYLKVKPDQQTKFIKAYDYSKLKNQRPNFEDK